MSRPEPAGIDPRGPRFTAAITAVLLLVVAVLGFGGAALAAWILLAVARPRCSRGARSRACGAIPSARSSRGSSGLGSRRPTSSRTRARRPSRRASGFVVTIVGVILGAAGIAAAVPIAASLAFVAAFLNAAFGYCLGCQLYVLLVRARVIPRT